MGDSAVSSSARQSCQKKNQKKEQKKNKLGRRRNQTQQKNKHQVPSFISKNEPASSPYDVVVSSPSGRVLKGYQRVMTQHTVTHGKKVSVWILGGEYPGIYMPRLWYLTHQ